MGEWGTERAPDPTPAARLGSSFSLPFVVAVLLVGVVMSPLLAGIEPVGGDPDRMYRPIKSELARALHAGQLPLWSHLFGLGVPLLAESHVAALYPPNWLLYRVFNLNLAYRLAMWIHYLLLAAATYAYARQVKIASWGAALSGVTFTFCGFQAIHSSHEVFYHALGYLPLALLLADRYVESRRFAWLAALAVCFGAQLTLGHFQIQFWTAVLVLFTSAWRSIELRRVSFVPLGPLCALCWGAAIAAAQLGPTWELAAYVGRLKPNPIELSSYAYPLQHWWEPAAPSLIRGLPGGPEDPHWWRMATTGYEAALYVGTIPLILAFVGVLAWGRGGAMWVVIGAAGFILATIPRLWPGAYAAILSLPGFGLFRCPARYTLWTHLALALLAGRGFDRAISRTRWLIGIAAAAGFFIAAGIAAHHWSDALLSPEYARSREALTLGCVIISLGALCLWRIGRLPNVMVVVLATAELAALYYSATTTWGREVKLPEDSPVLSRLMKEPGVGRIVGSLGNLTVRAGLPTMNPYLGFQELPPPNDLLLPKWYALEEAPFVARPLWRRFGATYEVGATVAPPSLTTRGWLSDRALDALVSRRFGAREPLAWLISRLDDPMPEARIPQRVEFWSGSRDSLLARLYIGEVSYYLLGNAPPPPHTLAAKSARVVSWNGKEAVVEHDGSCDLVLARTYYPGWTATLNGVEAVTIRPIDAGLQGIRLDGQGTSRVAVRYEPTHWRLYCGVSIASAAAAMLAFVWWSHLIRAGR